MTPAEANRRHRSLKTRRLRLTPEQHDANINIAGAPLPLAEGRLRNLEYDVLLRAAFYVPREAVEPPLHRLADAVVSALRQFPKRYGRGIAQDLGRAARQVTPRLRREIATHLAELGDLHAEVTKALDSAASRWQRFPPERAADGPPLPEWQAPENTEEERERVRVAKVRLEDIKAKVRGGVLLAQWPARSAIGNLVLGWRTHCFDWFATRSCPGMLAGLGIDATHDQQWLYTRAVQRAMRSMLAGIAAEIVIPDIALPAELPVSDWADRHRMLTSRSSAEPGPYRTSRTPYLKAIMDDLSPFSSVARVVFKKAAQIGASESGNNWIGAIADLAPGPCMVVQPTVELAKRFSQQRIDSLFEESPSLRSKIRPARSKDSGNTILMKEFLGGVLVLTGANSAVGLRSMPVRYLFLDEVDAYPGDVGDEGDPVALARARARTFSFRAKEFICSTPKLKGSSRISREYEASDQRKYFVPCPLCDAMQVLDFARLRWQPGRPDTVLYQCPVCDGGFGEHHKGAMLERGEWRRTAETVGDPSVHGYHLSGLYSPSGWLGWADIAREWESAASDPDARKTFVNTVLGEEWEEEADAVPDWERLYERRESWPYAIVPERGLFLTAGADVQVDRIEIDVWAWGRGLESWLVEHLVLDGDPGREDLWNRVGEVLGRTWEHATGARLSLQRLAVDTGFATQAVYRWARGQDRATVLPVRGVGAYDRLVPVSGPTAVDINATIGGTHGTKRERRVKGGLSLWTVSVSFFKKELYKHLGLAKPTGEQFAQGFTFPAGYVHLSDVVSDEWIKQLVAEQQVIVRSRRGFATRTEWRQLRPRNEALDCRIYARAAVWLAGADRWSENRWRSLEEQLGLDAPPVHNPPSNEGVTIVADVVAGDIRSRRTAAPPRARGGPGRRRVSYWQG